jgi:cytoskeletal protein CcmA (bactofilin family)
MLVVSEPAEFSGNVFVATAIIDGLVRGDIRASERVELGSTARVFGNIETPALEVQPGAVFEGQCHSLPPLSNAAAESAAISRVSSSQGTRSTAEPEPSEPLAVAAAR